MDLHNLRNPVFNSRAIKFIDDLPSETLALFASATVGEKGAIVVMRNPQLTSRPEAYKVITAEIFKAFPEMFADKSKAFYLSPEREIYIDPKPTERLKALKLLQGVCIFAFAKFHTTGREEFAEGLRLDDTFVCKDFSLLDWLKSADVGGVANSKIVISGGDKLHLNSTRLTPQQLKDLENNTKGFLEKKFPLRWAADSLNVSFIQDQNGNLEISITCRDPQRAKEIGRFFKSFRIAHENLIGQGEAQAR